jgi:hypothetical protein
MIDTDINSSTSLMVKASRKKSSNKVNKNGGSENYDVSVDDEDSELLKKDESGISISLKARKKSSGRKKSASSISESE